jgi:hypothetical protein
MPSFFESNDDLIAHVRARGIVLTDQDAGAIRAAAESLLGRVRALGARLTPLDATPPDGRGDWPRTP